MKSCQDLSWCGKDHPVRLAANARRVLEARYLKRDDNGPVESPEEMFRRVAREIAGVDACYEGERAARRGPYPNFGRSREAGKKNPLLQRNATVTTIAPAGTLSIIAGCSSGIEPLFALSYVRKNILDGADFQEIHPGLLRELSERGLRKAEVLEEIEKTGSLDGIVDLPEDFRTRYRTALEIAPEWHVRMQAAFQKHSDNGVSKTVNLPSEATLEDVEFVYRPAYELGCKGITVYRDRCRKAQVLNIGCIAC
jgi:ribonucleoside-diphosphate reductase alpha chain